MFTETILTRTELTAYETNALHAAEVKAREHSLAIGAFMTRYGRPEVLQEAAELFLELLESLTNDADIRTGALEYGQFMAEHGANQYGISQATQLLERFMFDLFRAVIGERAGLEAKAAANA
jgi:hypothetical protein